MNSRLLIRVVVAALIFPSICLAQNPWNIEVIGKAANDGPLRDYTAYGDYLYTINLKLDPIRYLLTVVDISNPSQPHRVRTLGEGEIGTRLLRVDTLLYVASSGMDSIIIYSLNEPSNPQELVRIGMADDIPELERLSENFIGIPQDSSYIIIDINDRLNPRILMTLDLQYPVANAILSGDYLFIAEYIYYAPAQLRYLEVFDISDTLNPYSVYLADLGLGYIPRIRKIQNYIYLVNLLIGIEVIDISDPISPVVVGTVLLGYPMEDLLISGDYAYTERYSDSLLTIDVSDPLNPVVVNSYHNQYWVEALYLNDENLYFNTWHGIINMMDISNPAAPLLRGRYISWANGIDIAKSGDYAYLVHQNRGVDIFDISAPADPVGIGYFYVFDARKIQISDRLLFVCDDGNWIYIYSLADPANPNCISTIYMDNFVQDIYVSDNLLYIAQDGGFKILDISEPLNPVFICNYRFDLFSICNTIIAYGDYVYTAQLDSGFCIYDVSDMSNPFIIDCFDSGSRTEFAIGDTVLFASRYNWGFSIFDISDPTNAVLLNTTPPAANGVSAWGDLVYLTYGDDGIKVFDVTDFNSPDLVGTYFDYRSGEAVVAENDTAFVAAGHGGLWIIRYQAPTVVNNDSQITPTSFSFENYPNPFNAATTIRYYIPYKSEISLSVYNLLGQRVETLFEGTQNAGEHALAWDASGLPSGIYFARLETPGRTENIKMVLLR